MSQPGNDADPSINPHVASNARVWDYWLGGKDNFAPDRQVGDAVRDMFPIIVDVARADRQFLARAVTYLAGEAGIRQFLDVGTGLPSADNTHQVAQAIAPDARVVYVDNDPMVLVHARALLTSTGPGATAYIDADARHPERILTEAAATLNFAEPVALMLLGILNFVLDDAEAAATVRRLVDALPSGSYVALTHPTVELDGEANVPAMAFWNANATPPIRARTGAEIAALLDGLHLVEPGLVSCARWRPTDPSAPQVPQYGAVARKA